MPSFLWVKGENGRNRMVPVSAAPLDDTPIAQPAALTLSNGTVKKLYYCAACTPPKRFLKAGVAAMHFQRTHKELYVDRDSWRQYVKAIDDGNDRG